MTEAWLVLKFGGTSVSGLEQWITIAVLAGRRLEDGFFTTHPLLMPSQSANDLCISLLLREEDAVELLALLHRSLVEGAYRATGLEGVFGPSWQDILK